MKGKFQLAVGTAIAIAGLFLVASKQESKTDTQLLIDQNEIINTVNSIGVYADQRNWQGVMECFAENVLLDYSSMGAKAETLKPSEIVERWQGLLPGFTMTQHMITNHRVTIKGDESECFSYVSAMHYLPNKSGRNTWLVMGYYDHHLIKTPSGWKVDRMKFTSTLIDGNTDLPKLAMEAAKK